jgi:Tol biopolymer transport system component
LEPAVAAPSSSSASGGGHGPDRITLVRIHLEKVLASTAFAGAKRSQDFLRLIIEHALAGRLDNLRERMIGAEMFGRPIDYDTANDAVVRVKANEVRRRLTQYYAEEGAEQDGVRIDLPTGTYVPEFRWEPAPQPAETETSTDAPVLPTPVRRIWNGPWIWILTAAGVAVLAVAVHSLVIVKAPHQPLPGTLSRLTFDSGYTTDGEISADGKLIAYASDRGSGDDLNIYVQEVNRGSMARFTEDPADDYDPAFSPDGTQIAFRSERGGGGIYQVSSLRGTPHLVVPGGRHPRFSPDGRYLLYWQSTGGFYSKWGGLGARLFTVAVAGGSPVPISRNCSFVSTGAVWSPDSKRILFAGVCNGPSGIWLASPDGKILERSSLFDFWKEQGLKSLDRSPAAIFDQWLDKPSRLFLPLAAGEDISYEASLPVAPDGSRSAGPVQPLVFGPFRITHASASRDGRIILSAQEEGSSVWMLKVNSSGHAAGSPVPLKTSSLVNYEPTLSKDGKNVAFVARESGNWELQLINLASGSLTHLSARLPHLRSPVFNSKGDRVYYSGQVPDSQRISDYELPLESAIPQTVLEKSLGGLWDESPDGHWLITHRQKQAATPLGVSYDDNNAVRDTLALVDRNTRQVKPFLSDPDGNLYQGHFSHDGAWVTFLAVRNHSRIYVAPFSPPEEIPITNWIPITDGSIWDDKPNFSFDGNLIYFTSDRDGFRCIWAQRLTSDMHPSGGPFVVYHFHSQRRSLANLPIGMMSLAAGPGVLVFNQGEYTGNLWLHDQK